MEKNKEDISMEMEDFKSEAKELTYSPITQYVMDKFSESKNARGPIEKRMAKAWVNFRGHFKTAEQTKVTSTEKSKAFVKITKTKVVAGVGQVLDISFSDGSIPIHVKPTPVPEGVPERAHVDTEALAGQAPQEPERKLEFGYEGDDAPPAPGAGLLDMLKEVTKPLYDKLPFKAGRALKGELEINPSQLAANEMDKEIRDQFSEANLKEEFIKAIYESAILGSGCIKGPFTEEREYPNWTDDEDGERVYTPIMKKVPVSEQVSIWSIYPDPNAKSVQDAEYVIQKHKMTAFQLASLKDKSGFRDDVIDDLLTTDTQEQREEWENVLQETDVIEDNKYSVLEYWGNVKTDAFGEEFEKPLPDSIKDQKTMQVNIWVCRGKIIRMAVNPFLPKRIPYQIFHWEKDLYNFFGVGIAENMEDSQMLVNGFWRLAIDNAALAGNMVFEADEMNLVPGQDLTVYPGKIFRRRAGAPGQALFSHKYNSTAFENIQIMEQALKLADTSTGIPAMSHGQPAGTVGRTAMGMSMMMGAAGLNIKTVIRNLDTQAFKPLGEAYFAWNMQFNPKKFLKGDLSIVATGTDNLLQKEVKSQRLLQFLQISTANPMTAPMVNVEKLLKEIAQTLDLDPAEILNDPAKQQAMAQLFATATAGGGSNGTNVANGETGPMSAQDNTGGGGQQMGIGAPTPPQNNKEGK